MKHCLAITIKYENVNFPCRKCMQLALKASLRNKSFLLIYKVRKASPRNKSFLLIYQALKA